MARRIRAMSHCKDNIIIEPETAAYSEKMCIYGVFLLKKHYLCGISTSLCL